MTNRLILSVPLLFAFCLPPSASAQASSIAGTVKDSSGAVVPGAKITVLSKTKNALRSTVTDETGTFRVASLNPGVYDVVVEKSGFKTVVYSQLELTVDQVQTLNATMAPSGVADSRTYTSNYHRSE